MGPRRSRHLLVIAMAAFLGACGPSDEPAPATSAVAAATGPAGATAGSTALPVTTAATVPASPAVAMNEVVLRWNAVASQLPADLPAPFGHLTFSWDGERFPHPTFKGGSAEAYGAFAKVLLVFLQGDGTFDLLAANQLFTATLRSGVPGGPQGPDGGWTFRDLVAQFSAPDAIGTHDAATRSALASIGQRIAVVAPAPAEPPKPPPPPGLVDAVARWNAVAAQRPVQLPAPFGQVTFQWDGEHFPHPTFKGGSPEAYGAFADVLLAFLDAPGNFDLLAANGLFNVTLRSGVAGPQGPDAGWTFAELVRFFASPAAFGTQDVATRSALAAFAQRIDALPTAVR